MDPADNPSLADPSAYKQGNYTVVLYADEVGTLYINPTGRKLRNATECVEYNEGEDKELYGYIAYFSVENPMDASVRVPLGPDNYIDGIPDSFDDSTLPTVFEPGTSEPLSIAVKFTGDPITWYLSNTHTTHSTATTSSANVQEGGCNNLFNARIGDTTTDSSDKELLEDELRPGSVVVYPNPATDKFLINIVGDQESILDIGLFDSQGKYHKVKSSWNPSANGMEIDISELKYGIYILKININNTENVLRFIKE
jgi:hypothetical protein